MMGARSRSGAGITGPRIRRVIGVVRPLAVGWRLEQFQRCLQLFTGWSQVLQQFYFTIKVNEEGFVLFLHEHLIEKTAARVALRVEDVGLTAAGVDEQTQRERKIRFLRKKTEGLRAGIFPKCEIV